MDKQIRSSTNYNWFVIFLIGFVLSEAIYKMFLWEGNRHVRVAAIVKIVAQAYIIFEILRNWKKTRRDVLLLGGLFIIYFIGQLSLKTRPFDVGNFEYFNISIFSFLLFIFFSVVQHTQKQIINGLRAFEFLISLNAVLAIIGLIFSIRYFETYRGGRFGYDGFLMKSSLSSYFNLIALFYCYHKFFVLKQLRPVVLILAVIASIISGTKASWLALILVNLYFLKTVKNTHLKTIGATLAVVVLLISLFYKSLFQVLAKLFPVHAKVISDEGLFTGIMSFRNIILVEDLLPFINREWTFLNYLFGGMGDVMLKSGIEPIDLFYFFGLIGSIFYIYLFRELFFFKHLQKDMVFFVAIVIIISIFAGNFFYNSSLGILLCALKLYFQYYEE